MCARGHECVCVFVCRSSCVLVFLSVYVCVSVSVRKAKHPLQLYPHMAECLAQGVGTVASLLYHFGQLLRDQEDGEYGTLLLAEERGEGTGRQTGRQVNRQVGRTADRQGNKQAGRRATGRPHKNTLYCHLDLLDPRVTVPGESQLRQSRTDAGSQAAIDRGRQVNTDSELCLEEVNSEA